MLLAACASPRVPRLLRPAAPLDDGMQLAAWLPESADGCVVVRPGRVPARLRTFVMLQSLAARDAWSSDLGVGAYARAHVELPDGRRATRTYIRFNGDLDALGERARGLQVRWLDDDCDGSACRLPVARWIDQRTVEVAHHAWPRRRGRVTTARCVRAARQHPEAVEVSFASGFDLRGDPFGDDISGSAVAVAQHVERVLVSDRRGIEVRYVHQYDSPDAAALGAELLATQVFATMSPVLPRGRHVEAVGDRVYVRDARRWSELELARGDERLRHAAMAHRRSRGEPVALEAVDVANLAVLRHQVGLRTAELARGGAMRRALSEALAELLRRGFAAHPSEHWLAERLARVELDENSNPEAALAVIGDVLALGIVADREPWRVLRREALAHGGADPLRGALIEDGLARGDEARRAAEDLVRLRADAVRYEWAEGAWRLSRELHVRDVVPAGGLLARGGVMASLVALAQWGNATGLTTVQVAISTPRRLTTAGVGRSGPELIVVRGPGGGSVIVGAAPTLDLVEMRRLAELVDHLVPAGSEVSYVVQLADPGSGRALRLRIDGTVDAETLTVSRASPELQRVPWPAVQRYLARPLHEMQTALFPPPTLAIRAESPEVAAAIRRDAEAAAPGACELAGPYVRCRAPGQPESLGSLLLRLAHPRVWTQGELVQRRR